MAALNGAVKVFIVERLACFDPPSQVVAAVKQGFGITVSKQQVSLYNPTLASGANLSKTLREVFEATRKKFLADTSGIAVASKSYRLRVLDRLVEKHEAGGNTAMVLQALEQAAREEGGAYTNKHKHEFAGGIMVSVKDLTGRK